MAISDYLMAGEGLPDPGQAFLQSYQAAQQQRLAQQRQRNLQQDIAELRADPNPQRFADFYLLYPEMRQEMDAYRSTLQDADKTALLGGAREALSFAQAGKVDMVIGGLKRRAAAANESGRAGLAKQFEDAAKFYEMSPDAGNFATRMLYNSLDSAEYKNFFGAGENKIAESIAELTPFVGADTAKRLVLAQQAAKGIVTTSGPLGTTYQRADEVFMLPATEQPQAAASVATGGPPEAGEQAMTVDQFLAAADALGIGKAVGMVTRNGIPIRVSSPAEARKLPSGTKIILPDNSPGVVP